MNRHQSILDALRIARQRFANGGDALARWRDLHSAADQQLQRQFEGVAGGGDGFSGSYGYDTTTPAGPMSSTSTGPAAPAGTSPGFSFTGAPIGAVESYDLPAPVANSPLSTQSVQSTSVAPTPGMFGDMYTGKAAANPFGALAQCGALQRRALVFHRL